MNDVQEIREVLAHYVRATDARDGAAQGKLFTDDAVIQIQLKVAQGEYEKLGDPLIGGAAVEWAVDNMMSPHPPGGSSHHVTADHLIEVDGDEAHLNAQVIVFETRVADGRVEVGPVESGYYDTRLRRIAGKWLITRHDVLLDHPLRQPAAR